MIIEEIIEITIDKHQITKNNQITNTQKMPFYKGDL